MRKLMSVAGISAVTATAVVSAIGDIARFLRTGWRATSG
ncbi:Hypothetical Protein RSKD131_4505 (plasmid) [Cereibacter sphaeroides KD131]|nr:Hypothetical Protein RSKD131_4505 [Cereibacter sphaeroides KD131]